MRPKAFDHPGAAHLSDAECIRAGTMGADGTKIQGPPIGLLIGEMPGGTTISSMPLFPHPGNASGARLMKFSELPLETFLGKLRRVNVFGEPIAEWQWFSAYERSREILEDARRQRIDRVVCLGARVARAFGVCWEDGSPMFAELKQYGAIGVCAIPHPSGLTRAYNDPQWRTAAKHAVQWAAGYGVYAPRKDVVS